jgi:hypothetical protein
MDDASVYAESAQAREMDRRFDLDQWGNPRVNSEPLFHSYDAAAAVEREAAYVKTRSKRIQAAIAQMELVCPPPQPINDGAPHGARGTDMSEAKELAEVPPAETALQVFTTEKGLEPWLQQVRVNVDEFQKTLPELTTQKGRDRYASMAHQIAKSKTALEAVGKALSAKQKELPKKIDAERKRVWDMLESWQKEVRKPLDDWQAAEDARIDGHKDSINWLSGLTEGLGDLESQQISQRIDEAEAFVIGAHLEEFEADAARAKDASLVTLRTSLAARQKHEAELAAIAKFNAEKAEREKAEHEAAIAREAAEKAQQEAHASAEAERTAAANREQELRNKAEQQELQLKLQAEQAERAKLQAIADQEAAAEKARLDEIARVAAAAAEEKRQAAAREADKAHQAKINRAALEAFVAGGMTDACARQAVTLIAQRKIPAVSITY